MRRSDRSLERPDRHRVHVDAAGLGERPGDSPGNVVGVEHGTVRGAAEVVPEGALDPAGIDESDPDV